MSKYRSQQMPRLLTIDDLLTFMSNHQKNKSADASSNTMTQNQAYNNYNKGLDALIETIENSTNSNDYINSGLSLQQAAATLSPGNTEGNFKINQATQTASSGYQDFMNYTDAIDSGNKLINRFKDKEHLLSIGMTGSISDDSIWKDMYTVDNITSALQKIESFEANLYTDPMKKDKEVKYIGNYHLKDGVTGEVVGKDTDVIQGVLGKTGLKNRLLTALSSLEGDGMITDNEVYYVLTGDLDGLDTARTKHVKDSRANLVSYRRSSNTIRKFQKELFNYMAKQDIKDTKTTTFNVMSSVFNELTSVDDIDRNNPMYDGLDDEDIKALKLNQYAGMSIDDVMNHWERELVKYQIYSEREAVTYKLWNYGKDFEFSEPTVDEITKRLIDKLN